MSTPTRPTTEELRLTPQNPWPGLAAFTAANREFFYGRETEIAEIFRRVRRQMLTVLFGVSGLGKTSLLQAGLLPKLGGTPFHPILIRLDHSPGAEDLIEQVRAAITREAAAAIQTGLKVPRAPEKGEDLWGYFHDKTTDWFNAKGDVVSPALVFDQFEEIFTREATTRELEERKQKFMELLACLVENRPPDALARGQETDAELSSRFDFRQDDYRVVISLREDFLAHLESFKHRMPSVMENRMRLKPMTEEQALQAVLGPGREIVEEPAAREIVAFVAGKARGTQATGMAASATLETAAPSEADPVLLSLVCDQLNRRRRERKQELITADLLTEERAGIIQEFYERAFEGLAAKVRVWVEDELLTASGYRNRAAQEDALQVGLSAGALDELVRGRILHREERGGVVWVELTHDLLTGPAAASRKAREQRLQAEAAAQRERALEVERDAQQRKARRMAWVSRSLAAALLGLITLAWWFWDGHVRMHTEYYTTFAKRRGFFEGVGRLTEEQAKHRKVSFRLIYKGRRGQLVRVQAVDALGRLTPKHTVGTYLKYASEDENPERECQWEFVRDARGRVVYEMALNRDTNLVWGFVYSPATTNDLSRRGHFVSPSGMPLAMRNSAAEYIEFTYDANGFEARILYQDHLGNPQSGPDGAYGEVRKFDARGLPLSKTSLNSTGQPMVDNAGNSTQEIEFDALGLVVWDRATVMTNWDSPPRPILFKDGYHAARLLYDEFGNLMARTNLDLAGKPVLSKEGYASFTQKYDARGNAIEWACFDTESKPTLDSGNHKHRVTLQYDDRGNWTNWMMFDVSGRRATTTDGFSQIAVRHNERDQEVERTYLDAAGKPVRLSNGYARQVRQFDARGRVIEEAYFDEAGRPRGGLARYARKSLGYDERGNVVREAFFDAAGQPMAGENEYARMTAHYDERGNRIEEAFFDNFDLPVRHKNGYAKQQKQYDERGNVVEELNRDENGSLVLIDEGYSRRKMRYDERNNKVAEEYYNEQNNLVLGKDGFARRLLSYDERGNLTDEVFLGAMSEANAAGGPAETGQGNQASAGGSSAPGRPRGNLVRHKDGYARLAMRYDQHDNRVEELYYDTTGNLRSPKDGFARAAMRYDARRQQIEVSYFDDVGQPMNLNSGYARLTKSYDKRGNQTEQRYFDGEGNPALDAAAKAHGWIGTFDHRGNWTNWVYLNKTGQPTMTTYGHAGVAVLYNERGQQIEKRWLDEQAKLVRQSAGYAKIQYLYDEQDNQVEEAYFDVESRPVRIASGYARLTSKYNEHGKRTEKAYWDETGKLAALEGGQAMTISKYDARGNETEWGCFDAAGRPVLNRETGYHKWVKAFDASGRWTNLVYLDVEGGLIDAKEGFARQSMRYNPRGNLTETAWFDAAGNRVAGPSGYARMAAAYDEQGNQNYKAYFSASGQPARGAEGYTRYHARYRQGRRLDANFFYEPRNPTRVKNGYAQVMIGYDERGNQIQWACFDENNVPVPDQSDGVHMLQTTYDELNRMVGKTYRGTSGQMQMTTNGFAQLELKYDQAGNIIERRYLDERNEPVHDEEYYAREALRYDERGRKLESSCYWEPESSIWLKHGYALTKRMFDEHGNAISWACFDTNGLPAIDLEMGNHAFQKQYDALGNYTNLIYLDLAGGMVVSSNGYARAEIRRDALGNDIESFYFDERNEPMHTGTLAWHETTRYDSRGRKTEASYFFAPISPIVTERGYGKATLQYEARGNTTRWSCFDTNGQPTTDRTVGHHLWTKTYDSRNNFTNQLYFDVNHQPVMTRLGYAQTRSSYDRRSLLLSWACFGAQDQPVLDPADGTHMTKKDYDERGNWTNVAYFGIRGEPIQSSDGCACLTARYDARNNQTQWACFDTAGKPTLNTAGYARIAKRFNPQNQLTQIDFFDTEGKRLIRRQAVGAVTPGGPGAGIGLQPGDVILAYGGEEVEAQSDLLRLTTTPGTESRALKIRRAGKILSLQVNPGLLGITQDLRFESLAEPGNTP